MNPTTSSKRKIWLGCLLLCLISFPAFGQQGYSIAGMAMGKLHAQRATMPQAKEVVIEEYMNYHTHQLPLPSDGESVHMDMQWGRPDFYEEPVLQIGITTPFLRDLEGATPLNLALVVDRSGSMEGDRIRKVKQALRKLSRQLRPTDIVSLIAFDHESIIMYPAQFVGNGEVFLQSINRLQVRGSTDLNRGILDGYREMLKFYDKGRTNRMLILTDAITNTGVVDPAHIIANSREFQHSYEVDFSMICIGTNFHYDLARQFTQSSRSSFHFINDGDDLQKIFVEEVQSLLAPVAKDPVLELEIDPNLEIVQIYGYQPTIQNNRMRFALNAMDHGLTQVVQIKFRKKSDFVYRKPKVTATLSYLDLKSRKTKRLIASASLVKRTLDAYSLAELYKSYDIGEMAVGLAEMARLHHAGQQMAAKQAVQVALDDHRFRVQSGLIVEDADTERMLEILETYAGHMDTYVVEENKEGYPTDPPE